MKSEIRTLQPYLKIKENCQERYEYHKLKKLFMLMKSLSKSSQNILGIKFFLFSFTFFKLISLFCNTKLIELNNLVEGKRENNK